MRNTVYPVILLPDDRLAIKKQKICLVCKGEFDEGRGGKGEWGMRKVIDNDHMWMEITSGGSNLRVAHRGHRNLGWPIGHLI